MADGYFVRAYDVPQIKMAEGIYRRTMGTTDEAMVCEFFMERGAKILEHSHMNDQVGYVVFGKVEMIIGGVVRVCHPGDSYAVPGGVLHSGYILEDTKTIDVFSPPRNDYRTDAR